MNRRAAIRCYITVSAGILLLPSCIQEKEKSSLVLKNLTISGEQENMLAELSETIIPKTSTPGARDLSSHLFALMMIDDCSDPDSQKKFLTGLGQFENLVKARYGNVFIKCSRSQKHELLKAMENKKGMPDDVLSFYNSMKKLTMQSFTSSQFFLTKLHVYELVPARFHGCVPV